ncbi:DoxX family protein [Achromobacter sp. SD115]|uniref:DoxX family protein n=1 Tax=Achromobacter sp. SD115 TaxID=2782011 RepID=UPI001A96D7F2|nr:DoxX family protein [Achromobacter sp. SD115]MBO1016901.1 DoxX family protein [Achromobacter sp. SD115]
MKPSRSSADQPQAQSKTLKYVSRGLRILAAVVFLAAAAAKLSGAPEMVQAFDHIGLGQWFRIATGIVEVIGGIAVLIPATAFPGGLLLSATMVGAVLAHSFLIEGSPVPALILLLITAAIAWLHRPGGQATSTGPSPVMPPA